MNVFQIKGRYINRRWHPKCITSTSRATLVLGAYYVGAVFLQLTKELNGDN